MSSTSSGPAAHPGHTPHHITHNPKDGAFSGVMLWISAAAIVLVGVVGLVDVF